jgi:hypothetical protein
MYQIDDELNDSETQFINLLRNNPKEDINDKDFIKKLVSNKSEKISYGINKGKSTVWKTFQQILFENKDTPFVKCNNCLKLFNYNVESGNSSLLRHSKSCQKTSNSQTIDSVFKDYSAEKSKIADKAAICCSVDLLPFAFIEGQGFKLLAQELIKCVGTKSQFIDIQKLLPSRWTVSRHIDSNYLKLSERVLNEINTVKYFGLTCDHWVHDFTKTNYLTLTIQYIKGVDLKARVICTQEVDDKTAVKTKSVVDSLLNEFELYSGSYIMVTDNARCMKSAFKNDNWIGCSSHNLNLVQKHAFKNCEKINVINDLIENSKQLVTYAKHSGLQNNFDTTLKQMIEVRWDSRYDLLNSIKINYQKFKTLSLENNKVYNYLININEKLLSTLVDFLLPLKSVRTKFCSENTPTLYHVLPDKEKLKIDIENFETNFEGFTELKEEMVKCIDEYLVITDYHICATFLTPVYRKLKMVKTQTQIDSYLKMISNLLKQFKPNPGITIRESKAKRQKVSQIVSIFAESVDVSNEESEIEEVIRYYNYPLSGDDLEKDPIKFWAENVNVFPRLPSLAKLIHSIPATNLSSERNFNYAGLTLTDRRSSLDPQKVNKMLFIRSNFDLI